MKLHAEDVSGFKHGCVGHVVLQVAAVASFNGA